MGLGGVDVRVEMCRRDVATVPQPLLVWAQGQVYHNMLPRIWGMEMHVAV